MSVGYEHIDLEACKKRGIAVTNTPNVSTDSVSELTVSLLLLVARRLYEGNINREYPTKTIQIYICCFSTKHAPLGLVGYESG